MGGFFPDTKPYVKKKFKLEKLKDAMKDFVKAEADRKAKDVKVVEEGRAMITTRRIQECMTIESES